MKRKMMRSTTTPAIPMDGSLTAEKLLKALAGEDIISRTGTERFKGEKFSIDRSPPMKAKP